MHVDCLGRKPLRQTMRQSTIKHTVSGPKGLIHHEGISELHADGCIMMTSVWMPLLHRYPRHRWSVLCSAASSSPPNSHSGSHSRPPHPSLTSNARKCDQCQPRFNLLCSCPPCMEALSLSQNSPRNSVFPCRHLLP